MSKRKIKEITKYVGSGSVEVKVHYYSEWQEYQVSFYIYGYKQTTYYTNDKQDAINTANTWIVEHK